ncbi:MAG: hypothetical protein NTW87_33545 [Planctomycetota bacterium]|nr:hypothetical protein [Planctomycetota bacterium]
MAEKKPDPHATPPKSKLLVIGGLLLLLGVGWFTWEAFLRPESDAEKKDRLATEARDKAEAARKKRMPVAQPKKR